MGIEQTTEERKQIVMEYLTQIYFDKGSIDQEQLLPMALYLYRNADLGPKKTKKVAKSLVKLNDIMEALSIRNCKDIVRIEAAKGILKKIDRYSSHSLIQQYVERKAKETLECAFRTVSTENFVSMFRQCYMQLKIDCEHHEYGNIYFRTKDLLKLLQKNEEKKADIIRNAMNAKARLEVLMHMSRNPKKILVLSEMSCALDYALEELRYRDIQEETNIANAAFAQATRSSSYQKQISKNIVYFYEND